MQIVGLTDQISRSLSHRNEDKEKKPLRAFQAPRQMLASPEPRRFSTSRRGNGKTTLVLRIAFSWGREDPSHSYSPYKYYVECKMLKFASHYKTGCGCLLNNRKCGNAVILMYQGKCSFGSTFVIKTSVEDRPQDSRVCCSKIMAWLVWLSWTVPLYLKWTT